MSRVIAYDLSRLFIGPLFLTPRGIDRVDLAMARHIFADDASPHLGILPTLRGMCAFRAPMMCRMLAYVQELWAEQTDGPSDPQLLGLIGRIHVPGAVPAIEVAPARVLTFQDKVVRMLRLLSKTGAVAWRLAERAVPEGAVYLNIGQLGLAVPRFFTWLARRPDVACAMMLHDAIPIDFPHLVGAKAPMHHTQMIRTAAHHADAMIFNSVYTQESVNAVMAAHGWPSLPSLVRGLPLPASFAAVETSVPQLAGTRYFLVVSTVEPRKNHELLLRVWRRFVATMGNKAPHLVIVGAPGHGADAILAPLGVEPELAGVVHHVVGLSSPALASLLLGAAGMLCPTFVEGFGLPLLEANAMGVPAIVTDIPAHREVANGSTVLLSPEDDDGWARAILAVPGGDPRRRPDIPFDMTEAAYCAEVVEYVCRVVPS